MPRHHPDSHYARRVMRHREYVGTKFCEDLYRHLEAKLTAPSSVVAVLPHFEESIDDTFYEDLPLITVGEPLVAEDQYDFSSNPIANYVLAVINDEDDTLYDDIIPDHLRGWGNPTKPGVHQAPDVDAAEKTGPSFETWASPVALNDATTFMMQMEHAPQRMKVELESQKTCLYPRQDLSQDIISWLDLSLGDDNKVKRITRLQHADGLSTPEARLRDFRVIHSWFESRYHPRHNSKYCRSNIPHLHHVPAPIQLNEEVWRLFKTSNPRNVYLNKRIEYGWGPDPISSGIYTIPDDEYLD